MYNKRNIRIVAILYRVTRNVSIWSKNIQDIKMFYRRTMVVLIVKQKREQSYCRQLSKRQTGEEVWEMG